MPKQVQRDVIKAVTSPAPAEAVVHQHGVINRAGVDAAVAVSRIKGVVGGSASAATKLAQIASIIGDDTDDKIDVGAFRSILLFSSRISLLPEC